MRGFDQLTPAPKWRAFFIFVGLTLTSFAAAPGNQSLPELSQVGRATPAKAKEMLEQFQQGGLAGEYYLEFDLRVLPRRGDERTLHGKLWGGRNEQGAVTRVVVGDGNGRETRFLLQNGVRAAAWSFTDGKIGQLAVDAWFTPLVPGIEISPFDLQMPFLYWPDYTVENLVRVLGRPAQVFLFRPPAPFVLQHPNILGVRVYLDTQFNAAVQTELIGADGRVLKTLSLVDLKRIGNQPMVKTIDVRNETTRDKTRFQVTAAALGLELAAPVFQPATLAEEIRPPANERITRLEP